ncbi:BBE domain-containing protein [Ectobacillus funiculus]|uniref:BBE domain-containing protein n=1 Tax=Ectobacillus funiculus TaxID=137993 RepID=UPI00319E81F1
MKTGVLLHAYQVKRQSSLKNVLEAEEKINFGREYYGANFARLREVKAKYDPENFFHFPQSIPPAY